VTALAALIAGCTSSPGSSPKPAEPSSTVDAGTTAPSPQASPIATVGDFPEFPRGPLRQSVAGSLQAVLDGAVEDGTVPGVTAAVIVAGSGSWSGASGVDGAGAPLTQDSRLLTASVGKTVTAAEVLRLVDEGTLRLDDPITDHLPPRAEAAFDANGATIRDVLGMRSGILDPPGYVEIVDAGITPIELLRELSSPFSAAGSQITYANINYVLLGMVIEHVTGRSLWTAVRSGALDGLRVDGLAYPRKDALAADGWQIETDAMSLARWGYHLYGGSVLSDASLREMTDFRGDWYGLGTIDFALSPTPGSYDVTAIGHGGMEGTLAAVLVAFPASGVVVAVQAPVGDLELMHSIAGALADAIEV
jgi:CubicO group peptidase (beta-lactamase class C family)